MATKTNAAKAAALAVEAAELAAEAVGEKDADDVDEAELGPLFAGLAGDKAERHDRTQVFRLEPVDEGHLGDLPPDCTVNDIRTRWGGGRFRVVAVDEGGGYLARNSQVRVSGDPIFDNDIGRRKYDRWVKQQFGKDEAALQAPGGPDLDELKEARAEARHTRELARIKAEADAALAKVRAELDAKEGAEERRRAREREERQEAEERRRAEDRAERETEREARRAEREEREAADDRRREAEREERRLERESRGDPMAQFATMAQIVTALGTGGGQGGPDDPVTALVARLPEILHEVRETGAAMMAPQGGKRPAQQQRRQVTGAGDEVKLEGPIATKALRAIERLKKLGHDPEVVLDRMFGGLAGATAKKKLPPGKAAAAPARRAPPSRKAVERKVAAARAASSKPNGQRPPAARKAPPVPPAGSGNNPAGGTPS